MHFSLSWIKAETSLALTTSGNAAAEWTMENSDALPLITL